jgi:hypothetical protein
VEDASHYGNIVWSQTDGRLEYFAYDAAYTDHRFFGDISAATGDINIITDSKKLLFTGSSQAIGTSTGNYPDQIYCNDLHYITIDASPWDDLDDLQVIMEMVGEDGLERMPAICKDNETFTNPKKVNKLLFGARKAQEPIEALELLAGRFPFFTFDKAKVKPKHELIADLLQEQWNVECEMMLIQFGQYGPDGWKRLHAHATDKLADIGVDPHE